MFAGSGSNAWQNCCRYSYTMAQPISQLKYYSSSHSDILRCSLISWLNWFKHCFLLGIHGEHVEPPLCAGNVPFCTCFLGEVIISDNEWADGKEYIREKMDANGKSTLYLEERKQVPTSERNKFNPVVRNRTNSSDFYLYHLSTAGNPYKVLFRAVNKCYEIGKTRFR